MDLFELSGKTALVTGGGRGLGAGMAVGLARAGADIILVTSSGNTAEVEAEIRALGRRAYSVKANLGDERQLPLVVEEALAAAGRIDILVNNSGIIRRTPALEHASADWHEVMNLNLNSVFFLCQLVGRHMVTRGSGKIINIASLLSFQGGINVPGYAAAKHGVAGITQALANEWAGKGINVNAIAPGYMATDNTAALREDQDRSTQILARIPAGRWGTIQDLQGPVVFLASAASDYMNGHVLCVDGGWMAR